MNLSRLVLDQMQMEQDKLSDQVDEVARRLAVLTLRQAQNAAMLATARQFQRIEGSSNSPEV